MTEKWATIQTKRGEKILGTLSVDFWFLLNIIFRQKLVDGVTKRGMMNGESWWEMTSLMSPDECLKSPTTKERCVCVCVYSICLHVQIVVGQTSRVNLTCCLTEAQNSGTLYSYHPIKHINIHVIWCSNVGQHNTTNFCFALTPLASLISSRLKRVTENERRASRRQKKAGKARVWIDLKHHHNLPGVERGPSVPHWSFHWQEPSQVPSKIYLSVLWCWHNVFLMSEIRLRMDEKALFLSFPSCFLPALMSIREADK